MKNWVSRWITNPEKVMVDWRSATLPAPIFRKRFHLSGVGEHCRLYLGVAGYFQLYLNSMRVDKGCLCPSPSVYDRHWKYCVYDVSGLLRAGQNTLVVILGNGWYNLQTPEVWHFDKATWRAYPKMLLQLEDGNGTLLCGSDSSWEYGTGPIVFDSLRGGEYYDARLESDWGSAAFYLALGSQGVERRSWQPARACAGPGGLPEPEIQPPCRVMHTLPMREIADGLYAAPYNMAGWALLKVRGESGAKVTLKYGEQLDKEKQHLDNSHIGCYVLDDSFQKDVYILKGGATESWEPAFTWHGFQYVQIQIEGGAEIVGLEARNVFSGLKLHGCIRTSDDRLTWLHEAALHSAEANLVSLPTDCPHREKNGWSSEAQLQLDLLLYSYNAASVYENYVTMLADGQRANGQLSGMAPCSGWGYNWGNGPAYDSALFNIPYQLYLFTGKTRCMRRVFPNMLNYLKFMESIEEDGIVRYGLGDWLPPLEIKERTPPDLVSTAFLYYSLLMAEKIAVVLGRSGAVDYCRQFAQRIHRAFNRSFHRGKGDYGEGNMTPLALALLFGLSEQPFATAELLRRRVMDRGGKVDYGTIGSKAVPRALLESGFIEEAFLLMKQNEYPGYLYWRDSRSLSTFPETWDVRRNSSWCHGAFSDIAACLYRYMGGFLHVPEHPGPRHLQIRPQMPSGLSDFHAEYLGYVVSWQRQSGAVALELRIPANGSAELFLGGNRTLIPAEKQAKNMQFQLGKA